MLKFFFLGNGVKNRNGLVSIEIKEYSKLFKIFFCLKGLAKIIKKSSRFSIKNFWTN